MAIELDVDPRHMESTSARLSQLGQWTVGARGYVVALGTGILGVATSIGRRLKMKLELPRLLGLGFMAAFWGLLAVALAVSCAAGNGTLTTTWTIASGSDPAQCNVHGASSVALQVKDSSGNIYQSVTAPCTAFSNTFSNVPPANYTVTAQMVDAAGNTASNFVGPIGVSVNSGSTTVQNIDFPTSAFANAATTGTLAVNWTIESDSIATECTKFGAVNISIQLSDTTGNLVGTPHTSPCNAFTMTLSGIATGTYGISSTLVDASGQAISTKVGPNTITVSSNLTSTETVDFPASAFPGASTATGSLEVDWTIASNPAAPQCATYGAVSLAVTLISSSGIAYGAPTTVTCSAQTTNIPNLTPGTYGVSALMLDTNSQPVSTTASASSIVITAGASTKQVFDFPTTAFMGNNTTGTLEVDWTLASSSNTSLCATHSAANIAVQLYDFANNPYGTPHTTACSALMLLIANLPPATYSVDGQLVDANNQPVTTKIPPQPVSIVAGVTTPEQFDFPTTSFTN